ncbi:MAG: nucleotidyltransferase domain-containing protein [Candidatus Aenigmarchaeota archaeon]|nr:nucleotidyltransferase domain-containing protein [Candidatus Aenigmarchaeota archaeon]
MDIEVLKEGIINKLKSLEYFDNLLFIYVFGSQISGNPRKDSDIDICLFYEIEDKKKLHKLELKVKGSFPEKYDLQFFQSLPLYVKKSIFKGKLIYCKNENLVFDLALKTFRDFEDFEPKYLLYIEDNYGTKNKDRRKISAVSRSP